MQDLKISTLSKFLEHKAKSLSCSSSLKYGLILLNNKPIYARLAKTDEELARGLMFVEALDENEGCLLEFPHPQMANIWMKNCKMNLAAAMIDEQGSIIKIAKMSYQDPYYIHNSPKPVKYVLEMNVDYFDRNQINVGDKLKFLLY